MDKRSLEKKLRELKVPAPDKERKELILRAAREEFERCHGKKKAESKGFDEAGRLTGEREKKSLFKGGPVMTRPIYATLGFAMVALFFIYSLNYYPGIQPGEHGYVPPSVKNDEKQTEKVASIEESAGEASVTTATSKPSDQRAAKSAEGDSSNLLPSSPAVSGGKRVDGVFAKTDRFQEAETTHSEADRAVVALQDSMPAEYKSKEEVARNGTKKSFAREKGAQIATQGVIGRDSAVAGQAVPHRFLAEPGGVVVRNEYAGRDQFGRWEQNPVKVVREEPVSTFSLDVDTASYAFVRRALNNGHLPQKDAVRVEELINYFDYDYSAPKSRKKPFQPTVALYPSPWKKGAKLLHIGIKGHEIESKARPRANLVFLLDVSGSMGSPDKLPLLKNSLKMLVGELEPDDTVAIAVYAGAAGTVLEPTEVKEKGKILAALERLHSGGSTAGGAGIKLAYALAESNFDKEAVNRIILATDGDFNVGIRNSDELKGFVERKRESGIYLSVLGFGQGNYNDALMQALAQNGNGNAAYIDTLGEARKVLVEEAGATLFTIAKDVKVQVEFNADRVAEYRLIGYESRILNREDFNNDRVDAGDVGAGHSVTALYEIVPVDGDSRLIDPLRYGKEAPGGKEGEKVSSEYAFLKIRYKLPDETKSRLITEPVRDEREYGSVNAAPTDVRFAAAVAAFGQLLKGGRYLDGFGYDDVITLAEKSRGRDRFGYRSEFLNLVRLAKTADTMGNR